MSFQDVLKLFFIQDILVNNISQSSVWEKKSEFKEACLVTLNVKKVTQLWN